MQDYAGCPETAPLFVGEALLFSEIQAARKLGRSEGHSCLAMVQLDSATSAIWQETIAHEFRRDLLSLVLRKIGGYFGD